MRLGKIVLKLKTEETRFGNMIAGAAELNKAMRNTLLKEAAFVVPLSETANENQYDTAINQRLTERFAVIVALKNDSSQADKTGLTAYDSLHDARAEIFKAIVGWDIQEAIGLINYRGGRLLEIDAAYLWYQFEFEYDSRLVTDAKGEMRYAHLEEGNIDESPDQPDNFDRIYANIILSPSADLPHDGSLPLPDGYPDVKIPDIATMIDQTDNPNRGGYAISFADGFKIYEK